MMLFFSHKRVFKNHKIQKTLYICSTRVTAPENAPADGINSVQEVYHQILKSW